MQKIILYYKFVTINDPEMTRRWQKELCERLDLNGRIIIAQHGINGTLGGEIKDIRSYIKEMQQTTEFKDVEYKWSDGHRNDFPRLSVKTRQELVTLDPKEEFDVFDRGAALRPEAWHDYLSSHPDAVIFDARNDYESAIGSFKNAIKPNIKVFKEIKDEIKKLPKDKPILTYCTGDIRCEYLSAYMKHKGFQEVYHLDGGIVKYGQRYGDQGFWEGKCYVFDKRMRLAFSEDSKDIGHCSNCQVKTSQHRNCANLNCNKLLLICEQCFRRRATCSEECSNTLALTMAKE